MTFTAFGWVSDRVAGRVGGWVVFSETKDQQGLIKNALLSADKYPLKICVCLHKIINLNVPTE